MAILLINYEAGLFSDNNFAGVYIRDLTLFNIGNEKTLKNGLLNFSKIRTMVLKVSHLFYIVYITLCYWYYC